MKKFLFVLLSILLLSPGLSYAQFHKHSETTGELNKATLNQIEDLIRKKAGGEIKKNSTNSFTLNGYNVYATTSEKRFSAEIHSDL